MKIALVLPPYKAKFFSENLSTVDEEFCLAPPIILAYVAAILEKHGHKVMLLDARALKLSREEALERIRQFGPDMLGFRAEAYHFHDSLRWMSYLKEQLNKPVMTGGVAMTMYPKEALSHDAVDFGITGEAIETMPALIAALESGSEYAGIPGVGYKNDEGNVIINPHSGKAADFNSYPFPARHLLPNELYYSFISQLKNFTIMLTSTGCPFRCSFCAIHPNMPYRLRDPKNVGEEMEACYRDFGIREIDIFDATFLTPKPRARAIFDEIKRRGLKFEWSCRSRVDVVDEDILREAAGAGCRQIYYGIESVDSDVLKSIKKDVNTQQIKQTIRWSRNHGIKPMGFFMVGNPGDTKKSVRSTINFAKDLGLDFIQVCRTIAKPGTELDTQVIETTGKDYWREHVGGNQLSERIPVPWCGLTEEEVESLTKEFYIKFYFQPRLIAKRVLQLKSFQELGRYIKVAFKMFSYKNKACAHVLTDTSHAEEALEESGRYLDEARQKKTAVVIPTYNEKDNIANITAEVLKTIPQAHIVIVDDNSPDGTGGIADEMAASDQRVHVIHKEKKQGLGTAYKAGFDFALNNLDSEYIFEMDADFSHNPGYIPAFLHYAGQYGVVTGSRFLGRVSIRNRVIWRNFISISSKWLINILIGLKLTDVTTGFKCFRRSVLENIDFSKIRSKGYAFQIEVSYNAVCNGEHIKELPILFEERTAGNSKMSGRIIAEGLFMVFYLMFKRALGRYRGKRL